MALDILDVVSSFDRTVDQYFSKEEFRRRLKSRRPQRVKYTIDIKTDGLHLGHAVNLWLLRRLQDLGHKAVVVFNDFTCRLGDRDGRLDTIAAYPEKTVQRKARELTRQMRGILRGEAALLEVHRNSEWYGEMRAEELLNILSLATHARLVSHDAFRMRIDEGRELYLNEMLYPVFQGYDSVATGADIALVGSDRMFHESLGRLLQEKHKKKPQTLITTRMTPGIDGRAKQSQRHNNAVQLSHTPRDKFGRIMSVPDGMIADYFRVYTDLPLAEIAELSPLFTKDPLEAKTLLARAIVARYHGEKTADKERDWFESTVSQGYSPDDIPKLVIASAQMEALDLVSLARPGSSHGDCRRLITQGGVDLNGYKLKGPGQELNLKNNDILKVGKKDWFCLEVARIGILEIGQLRMQPCGPADMKAILSRVPALELTEAVLPGARGRKLKSAMAAQLLKRAMLQPGAANGALFGVYDKRDPARMVGVSFLRWDGAQGEKNLWIDLQYANDPRVHEAMDALGRHVFDELHLEAGAVKSAFLLANVSSGLYESARRMDSVLLSREDAFGTAGFTREGWDQLQQWRRQRSPWLFQNEPQKSRHNLAFRKMLEAKKPEGPEGP